MGEIAAFVSGCVFSLLLAGGCAFLSLKVLECRGSGDGVRESRKSKENQKASREPEGGVILPKNQEEIDESLNEELNEVRKLLG